MSFTLRNQGMKSVKKKKLFERSEFFFFSSTFPYFSKIRAALTFCFFSVKGKEKDSCSQTKKNQAYGKNQKKKKI